MKTASWERNLNVMLNTFKNIIQMPEKFSFTNLGLLGISGKKIYISCFMESMAEMQM